MHVFSAYDSVLVVNLPILKRTVIVTITTYNSRHKVATVSLPPTTPGRKLIVHPRCWPRRRSRWRPCRWRLRCRRVPVYPEILRISSQTGRWADNCHFCPLCCDQNCSFGLKHFLYSCVRNLILRNCVVVGISPWLCWNWD